MEPVHPPAAGERDVGGFTVEGLVGYHERVIYRLAFGLVDGGRVAVVEIARLSSAIGSPTMGRRRA